MTPQELSHQILEAIFSLARDINQDPIGITVDDIELERPKNSDFGDWSSNIAMRLAKPWKTNPVELASMLSSQIALTSGVKSVDVAGPGFINIHLEAAVLGSVVRRVLDEGTNYGHSKIYQGISFNLEFVSANPTGPIHIGGTRWAAVGDSLARILSACGAYVTREYYFNDHGSQIDRFTNSLIAAYRGDDPPEDGYGGEYIHEISSKVAHAYGPGLDQLPLAELKEVFRSIGVQLMFGEIKKSLHTFGVDFDVYFHENSLHESDAIELAINKLRKKQHIYENEGAIWLRTSEFGDDKDRVIVKSDGEPAYIAADLAYYLNKRERGFERNIIMLGADHHGYVARMMAMCAAFGDEPGVNLEILIGQMVNLIRNGKPVRMSKRAGSIVTLEDLVDAVGVDASRYALVRSSSNSQLDIDLDLLSKRTNDNPVFYVQYAYARTCSVRKNAEVASVNREEGFCPELLTHESESQLLRVLQEFPQVVSTAGELREPHRVARYLEELAGSYHRWYDKCRVIPNNEENVSDLHRTRLWLNDAAGQVLKNGLNLLGVSSPQKM